MKKLLTILLITVVVTSVLCACGASTSDSKTIVVGASTTPHAEILRQIEDTLAADGYTLVIKEFDDYVMPNTTLDNGELDANYFQHIPYLDEEIATKGYDLAVACKVHWPLHIPLYRNECLPPLLLPVRCTCCPRNR